MRTAGIAAVVVLIACGISAPVSAQSSGLAVKPADELSAQQQRRARTRVEVRPQRRSPPGPNYVRECTSWLQPENRPSGPVITPQMRCWWVPGRST